MSYRPNLLQPVVLFAASDPSNISGEADVACFAGLAVVSSKQFALLLQALPHIKQQMSTAQQPAQAAPPPRQQRQSAPLPPEEPRNGDQLRKPAAGNGSSGGQPRSMDAWGVSSGALPARSAFHDPPGDVGAADPTPAWHAL